MNKNELFGEYFERYKDQLVRFLVSRGVDYETAQETCQQIFCAFYVCMEKIEPDYVKSWLFRSAQNALIDYYRKKSSRNEVSLEAALLKDQQGAPERYSESCENQIIQGELIGRILREVKKESTVHYEILKLVCVDELSYKEVAEKLNLSEEAVRVRLYRSRKFVRERFAEEYREL